MLFYPGQMGGGSTSEFSGGSGATAAAYMHRPHSSSHVYSQKTTIVAGDAVAGTELEALESVLDSLKAQGSTARHAGPCR